MSLCASGLRGVEYASLGIDARELRTLDAGLGSDWVYIVARDVTIDFWAHDCPGVFFLLARILKMAGSWLDFWGPSGCAAVHYSARFASGLTAL